MNTYPWKNEPNIVSKMFKEYHLLILRHFNSKHLCGYVGVPKNHVLHGKSDNWEADKGSVEQFISNLNVHGGVTYTGTLELRKSIEKELSEQDIIAMQNFWYIGFDCAHLGDYTLWHTEGTYRNIEYVKEQITDLLVQIELFKKR